MAQWWERSPHADVAWVRFRPYAVNWLSLILALALLHVFWRFKMQEYHTPVLLHFEKPIFQNSNSIRKEVRTWKPAKADVAFFLNI